MLLVDAAGCEDNVCNYQSSRNYSSTPGPAASVSLRKAVSPSATTAETTPCPASSSSQTGWRPWSPLARRRPTTAVEVLAGATVQLWELLSLENLQNWEMDE